MTISEAAIALRVSPPQTVRRMIDSHELRAVKLGREQGRTIRVPVDALEEARSRPARRSPRWRLARP